MRWSVISIILVSSLCWAGSNCPDPTKQLAKSGGESFIAGNVYRHSDAERKPLKFAEVQIYSLLGQAAYVGQTDTNGWFATGSLPSGIYRVVIRGWGETR